jgi:predicted DNA-binding transcriptional regulator YafY
VVSAPWPYQVRVVLRAPASVVAERTTPNSGRVTDLGDGTCELVTGYDSLADLTTYLSGFGVPFTVLEPPELRAFLRELAGRYLDASS